MNNENEADMGFAGPAFHRSVLRQLLLSVPLNTNDFIFFCMKFFLLVSLLLIYFPVLLYYKSRMIRVMAGAGKPEHLRWYEGIEYVITHTADIHLRETLTGLRKQLRNVSITGIILFWLIVFFYP